MAVTQRRRLQQTWPSDGTPSTTQGTVSCGAEGDRVPLIALVDDEASIRRVLDRLLDQEGFIAVHAASVGQLIAAMEHQTVDGVLLDLGLQGNESGIDALEWIRAQPQYEQTPVLILTGRAELTPDDQAAIQRLGAPVFQKGQSLEPIIRHLTALLRREA